MSDKIHDYYKGRGKRKKIKRDRRLNLLNLLKIMKKNSGLGIFFQNCSNFSMNLKNIQQVACPFKPRKLVLISSAVERVHTFLDRTEIQSACKMLE